MGISLELVKQAMERFEMDDTHNNDNDFFCAWDHFFTKIIFKNGHPSD